MTEQNNNVLVLVEQIRQMRKDVDALESENRDLTRKFNVMELATHSTSQTITHMNEMMKRMESMMDTFTDSFSKKLDKQNEKIDEFINSDKRRDSKKNLIVSIAQIVAGIIGTIGALWASGKL